MLEYINWYMNSPKNTGTEIVRIEKVSNILKLMSFSLIKTEIVTQ